jgi:cysteine desulfurase
VKRSASEVFGNPSSTHRWGRAAAAALDEARADIASVLGAKPSEVSFVRGGTESDNLAIMGTSRGDGSPHSIFVSEIEHSAVLEAADHVADTEGATVTRLHVSHDGAIDLGPLDAITDGSTSLISVMWVNNETGLTLPIPDVVEAGRTRGSLVHSDASQAMGKVPVHVGSVGVDLLTATGHKIYGPAGMGILFAREGTALRSLHHGGGQERSLRPGTEDVAGSVGLAVAIRLAVDEQEAESVRLAGLRDLLEGRLLSTLVDIRINCAGATRAPHVSSVGIGGVEDGSGLLMALDLEGIAVSGGSACHSGAGKGSHVIAALYGEADPFATVRFSFGRGTDEDAVEHAVAVTKTVVERMRAS